MKMICKKPYINGAVPFGCGRCLPCRINKRRIWTHRILLEAKCHEKASFVTLTYNDENLPEDGNLSKRDCKYWLNNLRRRKKTNIRYFLAGEYGDDNFRPHYHAAIFGVDETEIEAIDKSWRNKNKESKGFTSAFQLNKFTAQYICKYAIKNMTHEEDTRLEGRVPEFSLKSLRPGIGATALPAIAQAIKTGWEYGEPRVVPYNLSYGKQSMPLGRYLRSKLIDMLGTRELEDEIYKEYEKEMHDVQMAA